MPPRSGKAPDVPSHYLLVILQVPIWAKKARVGKVEETKENPKKTGQAPGSVERWWGRKQSQRRAHKGKRLGKWASCARVWEKGGP